MAFLRIALCAIICVVMAFAMTPLHAGAEPATDPSPGPRLESTTESTSAEPTPDAPLPPPPISWPQLGLSDEMILESTETPKTLVVPIPAGTKPSELRGQIEPVSNASNCRVEVYDGERKFLGFIAPPEDLTTVPFALDLSRAAVGSKGVELRFALRQDGPPAQECTQMSESSSLKLDQLATTFEGSSPAPATIADFLPAYLGRIVIHIGNNPSLVLQQTALNLVANLTHLYRPLPVRIDVDTSSGPMQPPPEPYGAVRMITIREDQTAGISVVNPGTFDATMVVAGKGDQLLRQVEFFADRRFEIAQTASADVTDASSFGKTVGTVKRFGELGMTGQLSILGTDTMYLGFDASQFGVGPIDSAEVNLRARYTPIGEGEGSVVVRAGSAVLGTWPLSGSGDLDITFRVPADAIQSNVGLALDIRYRPRQGGDAPENHITFTVQPESTVEVSPGTQTRRGFSVLPMAFSPAFNVAVDEPDKIRFAAAAINLMGQQTATTLKPRLATMDAGVQSGLGLLIVADGDQLSRRIPKLPLTLSAGGESDVNGKLVTEVELNDPIGVIETATDGKRAVLAITAKQDWVLVDKGFDYIRSLKGQWGALTGDVVATGAEGKSVNLTINQGGGWQDLTPAGGWSIWAWVSLAFAGVAVLAGGAVFAFRLRQRRRGRHEATGHEATGHEATGHEATGHEATEHEATGPAQ